jgi:hypothetical protein
MMHLHNKVFDPFENGRKWHKGETNIVSPEPVPQPTLSETATDWAQAMPTIYETQMKYAPLEAQQQVALAQQYAAPLGQAYKTAQEAMYPTTSALQENMASQATQGMNATQMPDWMRQNYMSDFNANIGTNAGSPIGADYVSRGMQEQLFNQQKYYRDLGLSLAGRQPLSQPTTPTTTNQMSTFTPQSAMNFAQQGYGTFASSARPLGFTQNQGISLGFLGNWGGY